MSYLVERKRPTTLRSNSFSCQIIYQFLFNKHVYTWSPLCLAAHRSGSRQKALTHRENKITNKLSHIISKFSFLTLGWWLNSHFLAKQKQQAKNEPQQ
jgi:hypothetical protein